MDVVVMMERRTNIMATKPYLSVNRYVPRIQIASHVMSLVRMETNGIAIRFMERELIFALNVHILMVCVTKKKVRAIEVYDNYRNINSQTALHVIICHILHYRQWNHDITDRSGN